MTKFYKYLSRYLAVFLVLSTTVAWSQTKTVTGTITSAEDKSGIPGVNVIEKGTSNGTVTDADGSYTVSVKDGATLTFTFVGFKSQDVVVGSQTNITITLEPDVTALTEVVVVGYGTVQKKDLTGSVTQVSAKDFNAGVNVNPLQAIQGKVAGLNITQGSGDPNAAPTVKLRGYTSLLGGGDPLYVVDNVIGVPITSISPNDIENIDVLKDASASAIYGSRAANGVIIITTKRGKSGKPTLTFNNYVSMGVISNRFDLLDGQGYRDEVSRIKGDVSFADNLRFPKDANGNNYNTDWIKEITRTAVTNNHELAMSGGSEGLSYRGSVNYIKQQGTIQNTGLERVTGRINLDQRLLDNKLKIQYNLAFTNSNKQLSNGDVVARATTFLPTLPVNNPDGSFYEVGGSFDLFNPVAMLKNYKNDEVNKVFIGGLNLAYEVLPGLTLGANGAFKNDNTINSQAYNGFIKAYSGNNGNTSKNLYQTNNILMELTANYKKTFGVNNFSLLGGYSYQSNTDDGFGANNNNYIAGLYNAFGYNNLGQGRATLLNGSTGYVSSYKNNYKLISFFARGNLNLQDKYNFTATVRRDGSTKFGANNKWGIFPSVSAGWTITNEAFMGQSNVLTNLKLRGGWGQTGNSENLKPYGSLLLYGQSGTYYDGAIGDFVPGYAAIQNANPNLKWEVVEQTNIGLDFELWGGKLSGSLDAYDKRTKDMLYIFNVPLDGVKYVTNQITSNTGTMSNKGIELSLRTTAVQNGKFTWNTSLVGSFYRNKIVSLNAGEFNAGIIKYNPFGGRGLSNVFASQLRAGRPLGEFYIPEFSGFDAGGNVTLVAEDGGPATTDYSKAHLFNKGGAQPVMTLAWINSFRYGNFDLSFQLRSIMGNKIMNNLRSNLLLPGSILETNMLKDVANYPANYGTNQLSSLWLENAGFLRMDNWQLGYNIPTAGTIITNARIYLAGNNLFVLTKYKGIDPELEVKGDLQTNGDGSTSQTPNTLGMDFNNIYPKTRTFQLGVNLTF
ncbi:MAG: TonB-dependent receptor [Chryseolinea sp.]